MLRCVRVARGIVQNVTILRSRRGCATNQSTAPPLSERDAPTNDVKAEDIKLSTQAFQLQATENEPAQETSLNASFPFYPPGSPPHTDLPTFLAHARRTGLAQSSSVFRGTYYEYLTQQTLQRYGFRLQRVGGRADQGIDLLGFWELPPFNTPLRVLIQCKRIAGKLGPQVVREVEGAFAGAPTGWRGAETMGVLVGNRAATKGVVATLGRCARPMGWVCLEEEENGTGRIRQILWNQRAGQLGLEGVDVVKRYDDGERDEVVLMHKGKILTGA